MVARASTVQALNTPHNKKNRRNRKPLNSLKPTALKPPQQQTNKFGTAYMYLLLLTDKRVKSPIVKVLIRC